MTCIIVLHKPSLPRRSTSPAGIDGFKSLEATSTRLLCSADGLRGPEPARRAAAAAAGPVGAGRRGGLRRLRAVPALSAGQLHPAPRGRRQPVPLHLARFQRQRSVPIDAFPTRPFLLTFIVRLHLLNCNTLQKESRHKNSCNRVL